VTRVGYPLLPRVDCTNQTPRPTPTPPPSLHHHATTQSLLHPLLALVVSTMESLLYKTPSPVTAKRRLSGLPARLGGRADRVMSEQIQRIQRDWPDLEDVRGRRGSVGNVTEFAQTLREETESIDSSMGFRELERVPP
jgi:hypothetical protein